MDGVVTLREGQVRGQRIEDVWRFAGVPYAQSPSGSLRWRPPQRPEPWSGVRAAFEFGAVAPQTPPAPGTAIPGDPERQSEDCLSLNIWTPGTGDHQRPVMVWFHGGGFTSGTGSSQLYAGGRLALDGDVVVVTCNYRLGALGYLGHSALGEGGSSGAQGNWGLLDQIAVLRWVNDHIAGFGGDPGNVTIFGESAGAMSVSALLGVPLARGLFHRAIVQSGPPYWHSRQRAQRAGDDLGALLGVGALDRAKLEQVPSGDLVGATQALQNRAPGAGELPLPFLPVVDGVVLPRPPEEAVADGRASEVPLLIGSNRDELTFFGLGDQRLATIDEGGLHSWIQRAAPAVPSGPAVASYRAARRARGETDDPRSLWVAMGSDAIFRWPSLRLASSQSIHQRATFLYLFTWASPAFGGLLGSCHALEIPFVFGTFAHPAVAPFAGAGPAAAAALSEAMRSAWTSFARSGDPSLREARPWPAWDPERRPTMVFGDSSQVVEGPCDEELAAWAVASPLAGSGAAGAL